MERRPLSGSPEKAAGCISRLKSCHSCGRRIFYKMNDILIIYRKVYFFERINCLISLIQNTINTTFFQYPTGNFPYCECLSKKYTF